MSTDILQTHQEIDRLRTTLDIQLVSNTDVAGITTVAAGPMTTGQMAMWVADTFELGIIDPTRQVQHTILYSGSMEIPHMVHTVIVD